MLLNPLLARSILQTDEFNATVINGSLWNIASTCQGLNQGGFCYANDTSIIYPFNGTLVIQPKIKTQCINATCGVQVASGRVSSAFTSNTGRYEIRAQLPSGDYLKSSVWLFIDTQETQDDGYEDALGEIDILLAASNATSNVTSNIWANDAMSGNVTQVATSNYFKNGTDFTAGFHTFSLEWTCKNLTIFVDNVPVLQKSIKKNRNAFSPNWFNYLLNIDVTVG